MALVAPVAPVAQTMSDHHTSIEGILAPHDGILIRQKLDQMEMFCPAYNKENKYKVAIKPKDKGSDPKDWEDKVFKKALKTGEIVTMKEKSDFCARICCQNYREFTMKMKAGDDANAEGNLGTIFRPCKCTILLCGVMLLNPQEVQVENKKGEKLGKVTQKWIIPGSCCCSRYWSVTNGEGKERYLIKQKYFCDQNCWAPTMCCPVHKIEIQTPDGAAKVGEINDYFPGCSFKKIWRCFGEADNFMVNFPKDATGQDKALLLAATILIDYMVFEKGADDQGMALAL